VTIVQARRIEDCFEGSQIQEVAFDGPITDRDVRRLGQLGRLQYFTQFPRALFVVHDPQRFTLKGLVGNTTLRCVMYTNDVSGTVSRLAACLAPDAPSPEKEEIHAASVSP
jgi:hypothetical protein